MSDVLFTLVANQLAESALLGLDDIYSASIRDSTTMILLLRRRNARLADVLISPRSPAALLMDLYLGWRASISEMRWP